MNCSKDSLMARNLGYSQKPKLTRNDFTGTESHLCICHFDAQYRFEAPLKATLFSGSMEM